MPLCADMKSMIDRNLFFPKRNKAACFLALSCGRRRPAAQDLHPSAPPTTRLDLSISSFPARQFFSGAMKCSRAKSVLRPAAGQRFEQEGVCLSIMSHAQTNPTTPSPIVPLIGYWKKYSTTTLTPSILFAPSPAPPAPPFSKTKRGCSEF